MKESDNIFELFPRRLVALPVKTRHTTHVPIYLPVRINFDTVLIA